MSKVRPLDIEDILSSRANSHKESGVEIEMQENPSKVGLTSWYDKFMVFKPLGLEMFDKQVLKLI